MEVIENLIRMVSPGRAARRARAAAEAAAWGIKKECILAQADILGEMDPSRAVKNTGYSHGGASRRRRFARKYDSSSRSPREDIEENRKILRERSRDLSMNSPIGAAAVSTTRTNCVGCGLFPNPKIDHEELGISREEAKELQKTIKKEFAIWADSTLCDANDQNNFYELQQIAFLDWLRNGEEFVLIRYEEATDYMPYQLRLKLVEADRICDPDSLDGDYDGFERKAKNGNRIVNGVEIEESGKVAAYYVCSKYPGENSMEKLEWKRIQKRGRRTGNPNILHVFSGERAEQYRGVPFLAPVIEAIKQVTRYCDAEIMAAVVNSMFAVFITTENGNDAGDFEGEDEEDAQAGDEEDEEIRMGTGTVHYLKNGEGVHPVESKHPSLSFDAFLSAMVQYIGAALEISPEVLMKQFRNSFSASKGAQNESWKAFKTRRKWFVNDFCQEVYNLWFAEAVSKGKICAPGFFNSVRIRMAYTRCTWNGPAQGQIDPVKEVGAAVSRVGAGFSTRSDECTAMNGTDYEENVRALEEENVMLKKAQDALESEERGKKDGEKD